MIELLDKSSASFEKAVAETLKEKILRLMGEAQKEGSDKEYDAFFAKTLKDKYDVTDVSDLSDEDEKEFYAYIEKTWKADDEDSDGDEKSMDSDDED